MHEFYDIVLPYCSSPRRIDMIQWLEARGYKFNVVSDNWKIDERTSQRIRNNSTIWRLYDKEAATLFKMFWE